ncbi:hypothetical protein LUZ60_015545 [Juncus effusus]|nr:hypothetical protein LUZ60_015545 [Juncus effusus]
MDRQGLQLGETMEDTDATAAAVTTCISAMIDSGSVESHRYFLARRTVLEMLRDRGYSVPETEIERSLADFRAWWNPNLDLDQLTVCYTLATDLSKKIKVLFLGPEAVKIATIRDIHNRVSKDGLSRLILVLQSKISSRARDAMKLIFSFKVEIFQLNELLVNITKHVLERNHIVLNPEQKIEFLTKYKVDVSQLPRMLENDAVSRYYGLEKGTVLKIAYEGDLTGSYVTYKSVF